MTDIKRLNSIARATRRRPGARVADDDGTQAALGRRLDEVRRLLEGAERHRVRDQVIVRPAPNGPPKAPAKRPTAAGGGRTRPVRLKVWRCSPYRRKPPRQDQGQRASSAACTPSEDERNDRRTPPPVAVQP